MIEIELRIEENQVRVTAAGSDGQRPEPHLMGAEITLERLEAFAKKVGGSIRRGARLDDPTLEEARTLYEALFQGELRDVLSRAAEPSKESPLVRLMIRSRALQKIPWEALCRPGTSEDFLATGSRLLVARGVSSSEPCRPRDVEGPVRILAVAPTEDRGVQVLQTALADSIKTKAIDWVPPILGAQATKSLLFKRIRERAIPHVLHFLGHGGVDESGHPTLRLADDEDGEEVWIKAETLAQELKANFGDELRLIVLEACDGARPGSLGSAAEILAQAGARAVVAHLWPVRADAARACSEAFYHTFVAAPRDRGNVVASLCAARRTLLADSAEGFSPVVYLRGVDPILFDFEHQPGASKAGEPAPAASTTKAAVGATTVSIFLGEAGFDPGSAMFVVGLVVLERPDPVRDLVEKARDDMLHDVYLRQVPGIRESLQRGLSYKTDDPDVRGRFIDVLAGLPFEAYVAFARRDFFGDKGDERAFDKLLDCALFDRLRAHKTRGVVVYPARGEQRGRAPAVVDACAQRVAERDGAAPGVPAPTVLRGGQREPCLWLADYICALVKERVEAAIPTDVRAFEKIRNKVRLIVDLEQKQRYWRNNPLP